MSNNINEPESLHEASNEDVKDPTVQPLGDRDASIDPDPTNDPAQAEWENAGRTDLNPVRAEDDPTTLSSGGDEASMDEEIPASDLPAGSMQPETQGEDPVAAELGEEGQGDLAPEDL